ncbi:MAG: M60 family metallopeptidase [Mangrovibacterium sp.]
MKHIKNIVIGLLLLLTASSCVETLTDAFAKTGILTVEEEVIQVKSPAITKTFEVENITTFDIDTTMTESWCKLIAIKDYETSNFVTCFIEENAGVDTRETTFDLTSGKQRLTMTVRQLGSTPTILLSRKDISIGCDTTALRITVVSNVDYEMIKSDDAWFSYTEETDADGVKHLLIPVKPNKGSSQRVGYITFDSDVDEADNLMTITQSNKRLTYETAGLDGVGGNIEIPIVSATSSGAYGENRIPKSYDGDVLSYFQSKWVNPQDSLITLEYTLNSSTTLSYFQYTPYSADELKAFKQVQVFAKSKGEADYTYMKTVKFSGTATQTVKLEVENPVSIKLQVDSVMGSPLPKDSLSTTAEDRIVSAACAEIAFYSTEALYDAIFTGASCAALQEGVTIEQILAMEDEYYREIAYHLYYNTYEMDRVRSYEPCNSISQDIYSMKAGQYGLLSNATGIYVKSGEKIVVLAENIESKNVYIRLINPAAPAEYSTYQVADGIISFTMNFAGHLYVDYHTVDAAGESVSIHISGGVCNGVFRKGDTSFNKNKSASEYIDLMGEKAHLLYRKVDLSSNASTLNTLLEKYDQIISLQQKFTGITKYEVQVKNKLSFIAVENPTHYVKTYIELANNEMEYLCTATKITGEYLWELSHKIGKVNIIAPMNYTSLTETMPNLYTLYVEEQLGVASSSYYPRSELYADGFANILVPEASLTSFNDTYNFKNERIMPFWQLYLYAAMVKNDAEFYADLHHKLQDKTATLNAYLPQAASELLAVDLSSFFTSWGFGAVAKASGFPPAPAGLKYITEDNALMFKYPKTPVAGTYTRVSNAITITGSENIVAYEVRHSYYPTHISLSAKFSVEEWKTSMVIWGIGANGEEVVINAK